MTKPCQILDPRIEATTHDCRWAREVVLATYLAPLAISLLIVAGGYLKGGFAGAAIGAVIAAPLYGLLKLGDMAYARVVLLGRATIVAVALRVGIPALAGWFAAWPILDYVVSASVDREAATEQASRYQTRETAVLNGFKSRIELAERDVAQEETLNRPIAEASAARAKEATARLLGAEKELAGLQAEIIDAKALAECEDVGATACKGATGRPGRAQAYQNAVTQANNLQLRIDAVERRRRELADASAERWKEPGEVRAARERLAVERNALTTALARLAKEPDLKPGALGPIERAVLIKRAIMRDPIVLTGFILGELGLILIESYAMLLVHLFSRSKAGHDSRSLSMTDEARATQVRAAAVESVTGGENRLAAAHHRRWEARRRFRVSRRDQRFVDGLQWINAAKLWRKQ